MLWSSYPTTNSYPTLHLICPHFPLCLISQVQPQNKTKNKKHKNLNFFAMLKWEEEGGFSPLLFAFIVQNESS